MGLDRRPGRPTMDLTFTLQTVVVGRRGAAAGLWKGYVGCRARKGLGGGEAEAGGAVRTHVQVTRRVVTVAPAGGLEKRGEMWTELRAGQVQRSQGQMGREGARTMAALASSP